MKILITFIIALFFYNNSVIAHQPKLIKYSPDENNPYIISDPEISKAFYGKLNGQSHWYKIDSNKSFLFYAGILTPENKEFNYVSIKVLNQNKEILYEANGKDFEWKLWYEPYARDNYWKGPEIKDRQTHLQQHLNQKLPQKTLQTEFFHCLTKKSA